MEDLVTQGRLERARDFIWRNARLIDRHLFAYLFDDGPREPILAALRAYRNPDSGFGNALEPDKRCPDSQPVDGEVALWLLDLIDGFADPMVPELCDWLGRTSTDSGGLPFALESVNDYPHAPWWEVPADPPASLNPTAAIIGLLTKHRVDHPWVERGTEFCWRALEAGLPTGFHSLMPVITFFEYAHDRARAERGLEQIRAHLLSSDEIERDLQAKGYVHPPLDWAPTPRGFSYRLFRSDELAAGLEALAEAQCDDGGWPIKWPTVSTAVELEWRGRVTIDALLTLRAYAEVGLPGPG